MVHFLNKPICGDALTVLREIDSESVDVGVSSPPYNKGENKKGWLVTNFRSSEELARHVVTKTFNDRKARGEFTGKYRKDYSPKGDSLIDLF